jgi:hypothetical protein
LLRRWGIWILAAWLAGLGLERYAAVFAAHDVDLDALLAPVYERFSGGLDTQNLVADRTLLETLR